MNADDVAKAHPYAVQTARIYREVFGDGVKLTCAINASGDRLGYAACKLPPQRECRLIRCLHRCVELSPQSQGQA